MNSHKSNESSELKTFMANLRSGNLVKLMESHQFQFEEQCTFMCMKLKQTEEEITKKALVLEQNSHLIEKFQNQLQKLSDQNTELLQKQQELKGENEILTSKLQCAEERFAQLDIVYDQEVSSLSERNEILEAKLINLENCEKQGNGQFDQTQTELNEMLKKAAELQSELKKTEEEKERQEKKFKDEIFELNELNNTYRQEKINHEEIIKDLQNRLSVTLEENRKVIELENKVEMLTNCRASDREVFEKQKSQLTAANEDLKLILQDVKMKLSNKEKEMDELHLRFQPILKFGSLIPVPSESIQSRQNSNRKRQSTDDPKPLFDESSSSDCSSVSFYKPPKGWNPQKMNENAKGFYSNQSVKSRKLENSSTVGRKRTSSRFDKHIEVPESPVVSSSAFLNHDQKM